MKAAAYAATSNIFPDMITSAKSLVMHSSVDVIYFVVDKLKFPEKLPDYIECIDVSDQKLFPPTCPNIYKLWSWMVLMRATYADLFPDLDKILSLDCDTIVDQNVDDLWDLDLDGYFLAAVEEPDKTKKNGSLYVNIGVTMFNLDMIRKNRMNEKFIRALNFKKFKWAEQDCMNELCRGHILKMPSEYNCTNYTIPCKHNAKIDNDHSVLCESPKIIHFANEKDRTERPIYLKYRDIPWEEIRKPCVI